MDGNVFIDLDKRADNLLRYDPETITVPANSTREVPGVCSFVEILTATVDNAQISFNGSYFFPLPAGLIWEATPGIAARRLFIKNTSGAPVTYTIAKGIGQFTDNRLVLSSTSVITVNPVPTPYTGRFFFSTGPGTPLLTTQVVTAAANVNGVLVTSCNFVCGADPTALCNLTDGTNHIMTCIDSLSAAIAYPIVIPAGSSLTIGTTGRCNAAGSYRLL